MPDLLLELFSEEIPARPPCPQGRSREDRQTGETHAGTPLDVIAEVPYA